MAERERAINPEREERRKGIYDNARSKRARGEDREEGGERKRDESRAAPKGQSGGEMLARHANEREELRKGHEAERRDEHNRQRDEHRSMNARHETEHEGLD